MVMTYLDALKYFSEHVGVDATLVDLQNIEQILRKDVRPIAEILLDQQKIAGIGNIYRSEILWRAGIAPDRPGTDITHDEAVNLLSSTRLVMADAIRLRGSSIRDYRDTNGEKGEFHKYLKAYGRTGQPCQCGQAIRETKEIDGRTVYYCNVCQA
jgi:formamidopyrimidine-DNA glycosylase